MKIIDAVWEKRNLGISTCEVVIENEADIKEFFYDWQWKDYEYIVVKISSELIGFACNLSDAGFHFIETAVACHYDVKKEFNLNPIQKRFFENCCYEFMNDDDLSELHTNLNNILFENDRVALDPYFTFQQANNRYWGWINDELSKGSTVYKILYKQKNIGFFGLRDDKNKPFAFLGGIYKTHQNKGMGSIMNYMEIMAAKNRGASELQSTFSTNNRGAFAVHMSMGYILDKIEYVFVKHNTDKLSEVCYGKQ